MVDYANLEVSFQKRDIYQHTEDVLVEVLKKRNFIKHLLIS